MRRLQFFKVLDEHHVPHMEEFGKLVEEVASQQNGFINKGVNEYGKKRKEKQKRRRVYRIKNKNWRRFLKMNNIVKLKYDDDEDYSDDED